MSDWTKLPQDKMVEFVSAIFKKDSISEEVVCSAIDSEDKCIFRSLRGKSDICENSADTPYGYCAKHINTVQARVAKAKWGELKSAIQPKTVEKKSSTSTKNTQQIQKEEVPKPPESENVSSDDKSSEESSEESSPERSPSPYRSHRKNSPSPPKKKRSKKYSYSSDSSDENKYRKHKKHTRTEQVCLNEWNNYEHRKTGIVFDVETKTAYGVQHKSGAVYSLSPDHIEICRQNGWKYFIPEVRYARSYDSDSESE